MLQSALLCLKVLVLALKYRQLCHNFGMLETFTGFQ